jgi:hypothetical protein
VLATPFVHCSCVALRVCDELGVYAAHGYEHLLSLDVMTKRLFESVHRFPQAVRLEGWRQQGSGGNGRGEIEERSNFMCDPLLLGELETLSCVPKALSGLYQHTMWRM